jgi:hypothetical protein|tara:strand:- start:128 stop:232 length:105 start_codon:yes stop_codon:yes gene_type:complete
MKVGDTIVVFGFVFVAIPFIGLIVVAVEILRGVL